MLSGRRILLGGTVGARGWIATLLASQGCVVREVGRDEVEAALGEGPDAVVLEAGDGAGAAAQCAALRAQGLDVPLLVVLDEGEAAVVACLNAGANDCIMRPGRGLELAARVRAQLRLHEESGAAALRVGPFVFHPGRRLLSPLGGGAPIRLTATETAMLKYLHRAAGAAVPRGQLLRHVWGYSSGVTSHTVETHMYRLRRKIEAEAGRFGLLMSDETGYRLNLHWQPPGTLDVAAVAMLGD